MSSGLEAFKDIIKIYGETNSLEGTYDLFLKIKKELKSLEIIKKRGVDVGVLIFDIFEGHRPKEYYNCGVYKEYELTQQEFELLKEVLCDDN